jgi:hypothetical protein
VISPLLANIYLHYVLDDWFEKVVKRDAGGQAHLVRYADDFVACFESESDAVKFRRSLEQRLARFGLELEPTKTRLLRFGRFAARDAKRRGERPAVFGFTHYCGKSRAGWLKLKRRTHQIPGAQRRDSCYARQERAVPHDARRDQESTRPTHPDEGFGMRLQRSRVISVLGRPGAANLAPGVELSQP